MMSFWSVAGQRDFDALHGEKIGVIVPGHQIAVAARFVQAPIVDQLGNQPCAGIRSIRMLPDAGFVVGDERVVGVVSRVHVFAAHRAGQRRICTGGIRLARKCCQCILFRTDIVFFSEV